MEWLENAPQVFVLQPRMNAKASLGRAIWR